MDQLEQNTVERRWQPEQQHQRQAVKDVKKLLEEKENLKRYYAEKEQQEVEKAKQHSDEAQQR